MVRQLPTHRSILKNSTSVLKRPFGRSFLLHCCYVDGEVDTVVDDPESESFIEGLDAIEDFK